MAIATRLKVDMQTEMPVINQKNIVIVTSDRPILIFLEPIPIICTFMYPITDMQNRYLFTVIK